MPTDGSRRPAWKRRVRRALAVLLAVPLVCWLAWLVLNLASPFPQDDLRQAMQTGRATVVLDRDGRLLRPFLDEQEAWGFRIGLDEISPRLVNATVAVEDERFYLHPGVDPISIARAILSNARRGRVVSGASTITMQVMRLLDDRPRTVRSKAIEAFRALQLERLRDKREIMELYLNLAPYGGNLQGVEAASLAYFDKGALDLTLGEAALLAGLPKSPSRLRPDRYPDRARKRRDRVLRRMRVCGYVTGQQLATALREPVRAQRRAFPFGAPHFARMVRRRYAGRSRLRTTLDRRLQRICEETLIEQVNSLRPDGVSNGAVVLIENDTGAVRALVGSCEFFSLPDQGQVNGATAPRSPGSALKPFTYALAFDSGVCTPGTVLADVPLTFPDYEPENYDRRFRGPVTAGEALAGSLNVPAVSLLRRVGQARLCRLLRELGLSTLNMPAEHYGLSLALGSAEVTLLELTNAYAALARLGIYRPYRLLETSPPGEDRRVLSAGACYLVADALSDPVRLNTVLPGAGRIAWKTGTSWGHRDAWTVAYTPDHTVGVWLGNFSGRPGRGLVGVEAAAPAALAILQHIQGERAPRWYASPPSVRERMVCAVSGMPPGPHCGTLVPDHYVQGRSSMAACAVHREVMIDAATGACLCPACASGREHTTRVVEAWPPAVTAWLRRRDPVRALMPAHLPGCPGRSAAAAGPSILSPPAGQTYLLSPAARTPQKLLLKAAGASPRLYWFVDGRFHGAQAQRQDMFWSMTPGAHTILCSDAAGQSACVQITVR